MKINASRITAAIGDVAAAVVEEVAVHEAESAWAALALPSHRCGIRQ